MNFHLTRAHDTTAVLQDQVTASTAMHSGLLANRLSRSARLVKPGAITCPNALRSPRRIANMSRGGGTQHGMSEKLVGQSGRQYIIERVLQFKEVPLSYVYLAT